MPESVSKSCGGAVVPPFSAARATWESRFRSPMVLPGLAVSVFAMVPHPFDQVSRRPVRGNGPLDNLVRRPIQKGAEPLPLPGALQEPLTHRVLESRPDLLATDRRPGPRLRKIPLMTLDGPVKLVDSHALGRDRPDDRRPPGRRRAER